MRRYESDHALVEACVSGDDRARRTLVVRYLKAVRQSVAFLPEARGGRVARADVEDAVQLVFMSVFANDAATLRGWRAESSLRTYLTRVAQRSARKYFHLVMRRSGRFRLDLDASDAGADGIPDAAAGPEQRLLTEAERKRVREALLEGLSDKGREYYRLLYIEEADPETVAERTGTNVNNVYQWKNRILRTARQVFEEQLEKEK